VNGVCSRGCAGERFSDARGLGVIEKLIVDGATLQLDIVYGYVFELAERLSDSTSHGEQKDKSISLIMLEFSLHFLFLQRLQKRYAATRGQQSHSAHPPRGFSNRI
jgi:hypothetical protein